MRRKSTRNVDTSEKQHEGEDGNQDKTSVGNFPEENHSEATDAANTNVEEMMEKLPKIDSLKASETKEYQKFEAKVSEKVLKRGSVEEKFENLRKEIYGVGKELYSVRKRYLEEML